MSIAMFRQLSAVAAVFVLACVLSVGALALRSTHSGNRFDFLRWEIATVPNKWLHALGTPLRDDPPAGDAIGRYFALADRESDEGRRLENAVEASIEGRIDAVLHDLGIDWPLGAFGVWPPVDVELAGSPRVLVISPRDHIERLSTDTLRPDITAAQAETIEERHEARHPDRSALVVPTGGISTYPAVVSNRDDYLDTVATSAHEWTHHYLSVFPLGRDYFGSGDTKVINETVADIVGDEVAAIVAQRWPVPAQPTATPPQPSPQPAPAPAIDFDQVMRDLRLEVDDLLEAGRIEEAEQRMEEVRQKLAEHGIQIRRINQAYFAWYGTYAARPDSVDPLGEQLRTLRERAGSLEEFLLLVRGATTREDVAALLAARQAG